MFSSGHGAFPSLSSRKILFKNEMISSDFQGIFIRILGFSSKVQDIIREGFAPGSFEDKLSTTVEIRIS